MEGKPRAQAERPSESASSSRPFDQGSAETDLPEQGSTIPVNPVAAGSGDASAEQSQRQVIAVSASKGPAAFFNLARKFLITDEECDLSALEGAIVAAVDAAHLLERSQLARIVRITTSYVHVEPKRKRSGAVPESSSVVTSEAGMVPSPPPSDAAAAPQEATGSRTGSTLMAGDAPPTSGSVPPLNPSTFRLTRAGPATRELRRARIVITVRRTESYQEWLLNNPLPASPRGPVDETAL